MNLHLAPEPASRPAPSRARRLVVRGGSALPIRLSPGDRVTITDPEGLQPARLAVLTGDGAAALAFDTPVSWESRPLATLLAETADSAAAHAFSASERINPAAPIAVAALFDGTGDAGGTLSFTAIAAVRVLIVAPGLAMAPEAQTPPTDLRVAIETVAPLAGEAPPPLATPKLDVRIPAATATAYRVAAGDYIQIIDVDGKQCSDFLAFDAAALAAGEEYGLDPTTTRTLVGTATPGPGLHAKYFDARMRPLVEVVQDTVGRHDTFMLACTAKYYEDLGYPGHANCSDNFNGALAPFGIAARKGWPAINFFYNTAVDAHGAIVSDEPWSRPGDYVLVRALSDLVCASSSCADDIDPANAWEPTDIHLRVYDKSCHFPKGIAHRMTPDAEPRMTRESGFHPRTAALSRSFVEMNGFWLPHCFATSDPISEYWACRERAAIMDLSALRKFEVIGPDAEALMQRAITRDVRKIAVGQVTYTALCYDHGGMLDDGTVFRLGPNNFRLVCGNDYCGPWLRDLAAAHGLKAWVKSSTDQLHNIAVQGPKSRDILKDIVRTPATQPTLAELKWFRFLVGRIGEGDGVPVVVSRTGYTGEIGYEIFCHPDHALVVWDTVWAAGEPHGLTPFGLGALDMVRIESGLVFAGFDFCDQTDPFEAGIGFTVPADKADDYVGRDALARRRANPHRKLVGLEVETNEAVGHGDPVYAGRAQIGQVTSAVRSPILKKTIALARLDVTRSEIGTAVEVGRLDGHQKRFAATIVRFPHFDPEKTRVRG